MSVAVSRSDVSKIELAPEVVNRLLDRLEHDDDFRALFVDDTATALREVGAPAEAIRCLKVNALASKDIIRAARLALQHQLVGRLSQQPHILQS